MIEGFRRDILLCACLFFMQGLIFTLIIDLSIAPCSYALKSILLLFSITCAIFVTFMAGTRNVPAKLMKYGYSEVSINYSLMQLSMLPFSDVAFDSKAKDIICSSARKLTITYTVIFAFCTAIPPVYFYRTCFNLIQPGDQTNRASGIALIFFIFSFFISPIFIHVRILLLLNRKKMKNRSKPGRR